MFEIRVDTRLAAMTAAVDTAQRVLEQLRAELTLAHAEIASQRNRTHYSIDETAGVLGLSRSTVNRRMLDGSIRSVKVGGRRLIPADQFETTQEVA